MKSNRGGFGCPFNLSNMKHFSDKETARNMFSGWFKVVPIAMLLAWIWAIVTMFGFDAGLDDATAEVLLYAMPGLFVVYWLLFKYYDKNNP